MRVAILFAFPVILAASQEDLRGIDVLPKPETGVIDGVPAMLVWPYDAASRTVLTFDECRVIVLTGGGHPFPAPQYKCGEWFVPSIGRHDIWVEMPTHVSAAATVVMYGGNAGANSKSGHRVMVPVVPAGFANVILPNDHTATTVRVLKTELLGKSLFERQYPVADGGPLLVSVGEAIAGLFDANGNVLALTKPFQVTRGEPVSIDFATRTTARDVMVVMRRLDSGTEPRLVLRTSRHSHEPALIITSAFKFVAIWYDLPRSNDVQLLTGQEGKVLTTWPKLEDHPTTFRSTMSAVQSAR